MTHVRGHKGSLLATAASVAAVIALRHLCCKRSGPEPHRGGEDSGKMRRHLQSHRSAGFKAPKAKKPYHLEFSVPMFIPYIQALIYGAQQAAKDAGVTLTVDAGKGFMDPAAQITQLENALTHKPDAVLINPSDPDGMAPTIDEIIASGTPVFDVGTLSNSQKSTKVVQDDYAQGLMGAEAVAKLLPQGGQGILMGGPPNASWARRRVAGFLDGIKSTSEHQGDRYRKLRQRCLRWPHQVFQCGRRPIRSLISSM